MDSISRWRFVQAAATWTALSRSRVLGANDRIRIGGIGLGGRCRLLLTLAAKTPGTEIVALSDVYSPRADQARVAAPGAEIFPDYRKLLERKDVDAVFIGSPDHWHTPMTIDAVAAGKDVYVEKPVTHTIAEGARLQKAVDASTQVVQVGYQQRSWEHFIEAKKVIDSGRLGRVSLVLASWYQNYLRFDPVKAPAQIDTAKLDWNKWLGSAPVQPVSALKYLRWRWFWDFGGGHLTDLYSHYCDVIHWYMGQDNPLSVTAMGGCYVLDYLECPDTINAGYEYPGNYAVVYQGTMICHLTGGDIIFRGEKAMMRVNRDGYWVYPEGTIPPEKTHLPEPVAQMKSAHDGAIDHVANFLDCARSRKQPSSPVRPAIAAAKAAHLGNLAYRKGTRVSAG